MVSKSLEKDVHHKGFLVFVVRDWGFITTGSPENRDVRNYSHVSEIVSLAGLNAILYSQNQQRDSSRLITPKDVINAVNFDGVVRNEVGEQLEDVMMNPVESGLAQASVFNTTVRGRVPTQNVWGTQLKGNQMVYLVVKSYNFDLGSEPKDELKDKTIEKLVTNGYRADPNGLSSGKLGAAVTTCVQVRPWIAPDGSDRPPKADELGKGGYYISVGRCSDRKKYANSNEASSQFGYFDARCAITAPLVELHVETCSPPISYAAQSVDMSDTLNSSSPFFKIALLGQV